MSVLCSTWNQVSYSRDEEEEFYSLMLKFCVLDIEDVNKAFQEMHEEVETKVYRADLETALNSQ